MILAVAPFGPAAAQEWARAAPGDVGLDAEVIDDLVDAIRDRQFRDVTGLVIVREGKLVSENYFNGYDGDEPHTMQSVSKSFASAIVGQAIGEGRIAGTDRTILSFFPEYDDIRNMDDRKRRITLFHLLTMRSGTDYHERGSRSPHAQLNRLPTGWDKFNLDRPMVSEPGTRFSYDSGGVILTSALVKAATGEHSDIFAADRLFGTLGIERHRWFRNSEGHPHMGGGLYLRPRDMAKFGQMYLDGGRWHGKQVVPAEWVRASFTEHVNLRGRSHIHVIGYGLLWWIFEPDPAGSGQQPIYAAYGANGQFIFVVPEHDMVVAVTGKTGNYRDEINPIRFIYRHILRAAGG